MTAETVSIIITIRAGEKTAEIKSDLGVDDLEKAITKLGTELTSTIFGKVLELIDQHLQEGLPDEWTNVGKEERSIVFEHGYVHFWRRIYRDEKGKRRKPLDELLNIKPYERNSRNVHEIGGVMAADTTYRRAADLMSYMLKTAFSASSIHRMVKKVGQQLEDQENTFESTEPGIISAPVLNAESDGVWIHLQGKDKKRAEVKVAVIYTGKKAIGKGRFRCENKVIMTQLGGSTLDWQIKLRELADRTYNLAATRMLVVGGDGSSWVKKSYDLLNLPTTHLLDRFHVVRAVRQAFGSEINITELLRTLFSEGMEGVHSQLMDCIHKAKNPLRKKMIEVYNYLSNNRDALLDLDKRSLPDLPFSTLGAMEGNVDKLVRQRMEGRGLCWSMRGAICMLAVLRHKEELKYHSLSYVSVLKTKKSANKVKVLKNEKIYRPISGSIPIFNSSEQSKYWVQLLKSKLNSGLSINAFF